MGDLSDEKNPLAQSLTKAMTGKAGEKDGTIASTLRSVTDDVLNYGKDKVVPRLTILDADMPDVKGRVAVLEGNSRWSTIYINDLRSRVSYLERELQMGLTWRVADHNKHIPCGGT